MEFGVTSLNRVFGVLSTPESRSDVSRIVTCFFFRFSFVFFYGDKISLFVSLDLDDRIFFLVFTASDACDVIVGCLIVIKVLKSCCPSVLHCG